jgi:hypothetical protein
MTSLDDLKRIAEVEFADIVKSCITMDFKIRFILFMTALLTSTFLKDCLRNLVITGSAEIKLAHSTAMITSRIKSGRL